ncbi:hypothetical protein FACS1894151_07480 [Spirochaetia bacterium]|nr:hypothetical protein FACS1894151_07480 [Spirochaetia bacterium]
MGNTPMRPLLRYHDGALLREKLALTPYAKEEYALAFEQSDNPLEQARRTIVRSFFGFGTTSVLCTGKKSHPGFKGNIKIAGAAPAPTWAGYPQALEGIIERLKGVVIENRDAMELLSIHDSEKTVFYADPPYLPEVRDAGEDYRYEMTEAQHIELAEKLNQVKGAVLVSGYHSALYNELYEGWIRREKNTYADGAARRTEVLWMKGVDLGLFGETEL